MVLSAWQVLLSSWQQAGGWAKLPSRYQLSNHCLPCNKDVKSRVAWYDEGQDMCRSEYFPGRGSDQGWGLCEKVPVSGASSNYGRDQEQPRSSPGAALLSVKPLACEQTCPGACCRWVVSMKGESKWWRHRLVLSSHPWRSLVIHKEASLLP